MWPTNKVQLPFQAKNGFRRFMPAGDEEVSRLRETRNHVLALRVSMFKATKSLVWLAVSSMSMTIPEYVHKPMSSSLPIDSSVGSDFNLRTESTIDVVTRQTRFLEFGLHLQI